MFLNYFKLLALVIGLFGSAVSAADWTKLKTASDFQLKENDVYPIIKDLDAALPNQKVSDIIADTNHENPKAQVPLVKSPTGSYTWPSGSFDDRGTTAWYPQGLTTSSDAFGNGQFDGMQIDLVSWHHNVKQDGKNVDGPKGARITFIDRRDSSKTKYRHVLLVIGEKDSDNKASFKTQKLHAGGIMWYGDLLYVVDTSAGLRIFSMKHIYQVDDSGDGIGRVGNKYQAYGYKYVMPQIQSYTHYTSSGENLRFSWISLDRTTKPDSIIVGEYSKDTAECEKHCRIVRWQIDSTNRLLKTSSPGGNPNLHVAVATEAVKHKRRWIQGGASINGKYFVTQSPAEKDTGTLLTWDGSKEERFVDFFPKGPEDFSYRENHGDLWTLTEPATDQTYGGKKYPGRHVFGFDPKKVSSELD